MECPEHRAEERPRSSPGYGSKGFLGAHTRDETPGREVGHDLDVVDVPARVVRAGTPGDDGGWRGASSRSSAEG